MWPYVCIPNTQNFNFLQKTLCRKRKTSLNFLQGQQSITKLSRKLETSINIKKNAKRIY